MVLPFSKKKWREGQVLPNRKCLTFDNCLKGGLAEEGDGGQQKHLLIWNF